MAAIRRTSTDCRGESWNELDDAERERVSFRMTGFHLEWGL